MPDPTTVFVAIVGTILGNALVLTISGYIARTWAQWALSKDIEQFKVTLKRDADSELERVRSSLSRDMESYKVQLRKSEILFELELAAAREFVAWFADADPRKDHPHMEWEDAMNNWAERAGAHKESLELFLTKHSPALTPAEREVLRGAITAATDLWLEGYPDEQSRDIAESLRSDLYKFRDQLLERVRSQSSV